MATSSTRHERASYKPRTLPGRETLSQPRSIVTPLSQAGWLGAAAPPPIPKPRAAASASAKPTGPKPQPQPFDAQYFSETALQRRDYADTLGQITQARQNVGQDTGFDIHGGFDPSNPYNKATLLQRSWEQAQTGTRTNAASSGQLYSGSTQRALDEGQFRYSRDYDVLRRQAAGQYTDLENRENQAGSDKTYGEIQSRGDAIARAESRDPEVDPKYAESVAVNKRYPGTLNADGSVNMDAFRRNWRNQLRRARRRGGFGAGRRSR